MPLEFELLTPAINDDIATATVRQNKASFTINDVLKVKNVLTQDL